MLFYIMFIFYGLPDSKKIIIVV